MAEVFFALLVAVGVLEQPEPALVDLRPAYVDVVCYVECLNVCLWSGPPTDGPVTP